MEKEDEEVGKNQVIVGSVTVAIKMQNLWRTNKNEGFMCDCYSYVKIKGDAHIACVVQFYPLSLINLMKNETTVLGFQKLIRPYPIWASLYFIPLHVTAATEKQWTYIKEEEYVNTWWHWPHRLSAWIDLCLSA